MLMLMLAVEAEKSAKSQGGNNFTASDGMTLTPEASQRPKPTKKTEEAIETKQELSKEIDNQPNDSQYQQQLSRYLEEKQNLEIQLQEQTGDNNDLSKSKNGIYTPNQQHSLAKTYKGADKVQDALEFMANPSPGGLAAKLAGDVVENKILNACDNTNQHNKNQEYHGMEPRHPYEIDPNNPRRR